MSGTEMKISLVGDHVQEVIAAMKKQLLVGMETAGFFVENEAYKNIEKQGAQDTGALGQNITHKIVEDVSKTTLYVGTNLEYAPYVEYGTGIYSTKGDGRKSPWLWKGEGVKWEGWHYTQGQKPKPFLKPAVADNTDKIQEIIISSLKGE